MKQIAISTEIETVRKWKFYPVYKDSGVEWLGEIPEHWEIKRLMFVCQINPIKSQISALSKNTEVSFLPMEYISENGCLSLIETRSLEQVWQGYTYFENEDVIFAKITPCFENGKGALCKGLINNIGFGTTELHVLRANKNTEPKFIYYLTRLTTFRFLGVSEMTGVAGQQRVPEAFVKNFKSSIPPFQEQQAIASFLDRETAKIDALIAKKERLIELLQEKRTALISHAVTKGLNPDVPMKDSGVEWLGEIPAHWEVKRLMFVCQINPIKSQISALSKNTEVSFLPMEYISENGCLSLIETRSLEQVWQGYTYFENEDVIFAKITPCFENGKGALCKGLINNIGFGTTELHVLRANKNTEPKFIYYLTRLTTFRLLGVSEMTGVAGQQRVPEAFVKNFKSSIPPFQEQQAIASFLDRETAKIDTLITKTRTSIDKLKEYRTALISAAVTGKIDIREEIAA